MWKSCWPSSSYILRKVQLVEDVKICSTLRRYGSQEVSIFCSAWCDRLYYHLAVYRNSGSTGYAFTDEDHENYFEPRAFQQLACSASGDLATRTQQIRLMKPGKPKVIPAVLYWNCKRKCLPSSHVSSASSLYLLSIGFLISVLAGLRHVLLRYLLKLVANTPATLVANFWLLILFANLRSLIFVANTSC